jgi:hypothetical protein
MFVDAWGGVGTSAGPQRDLAAFEVAEEFVPFGVGGHSVLFAGSHRTSACDEGAMPVDDFFRVDGLVAHGGVDVAVAGDELGDVGWHPVQHGVSDKHAPKIVWGEP